MFSPLLIPIFFIAAVPIVIIGLPLARAVASRIERKPMDSGSALPSDVALRLERMEQSIDAIAVEIERVSEGQRFTTRLLAERAALPSGPAGR